MKKIMLTFGLIIGALLCANLFFMTYVIYSMPELEPQDALGFLFYFLVFALVFFGIRNYRNKELAGAITFGKAFKVGALISLMGSSIYVVVWLVFYYLFVPDFFEAFSDYFLRHCAQDELESKKAQLDFMRIFYQNPFGVVFMTYLEVLPYGLIVSLVSALALRKNATPSTHD